MLIDEYYEKNPAPLGSKDRKCPVDVDALFPRLNEENSQMAYLWTENSVSEWVKTLGAECASYTPRV